MLKYSTSDAVPLFTVHHEIKFNIEYKRISGDTASSSSTTISVPIKLQIPHDRPIDSRSLNNNHNSGEPVIPPVTEKRGQRRNVRLSIFSKPSVTGAPIIQQGCMTQEANPPVAAPVLEQVRAAHTPNLVAATTFREQDYSTQSVSRFPAMTVERHRGAERLDSLPATSVASQRYNAAPASAYSVDQLSSVNRTHPAGAPSAATGQAAYTTPVSHHSPVAPSTSSTQTDEWAHRQGKALFDYIPRQPDELRIRQGDVISIMYVQLVYSYHLLTLILLAPLAEKLGMMAGASAIHWMRSLKVSSRWPFLTERWKPCGRRKHWSLTAPERPQYITRIRCRACRYVGRSPDEKRLRPPSAILILHVP